MTKIIVLVGIPASNKTSWANEFFKDHKNTLYLSSNLIRRREDNKGNKYDNAKVFAEMREGLFTGIESDAYDFIIYDATNINRKRRRGLYTEIQQKFKDLNIHVEIKFFSVSAYDAMSRDSLRPIEQRVGREVIWKMQKNLQVPRIKVDCDAFEVLGDPIFTEGNFKNYNDLFMKVDRMSHSLEMLGNLENHDCPPHHYETIERHLDMCLDQADYDLKEVALFHDLGKGFCRVVDETGYAIYRSHENVSSHYFLNYLALTKYKNEKIPEFELENLETILRHMNTHQGLGIKNIRNNKLNMNIQDKLVRFAKIDKQARIKTPNK